MIESRIVLDLGEPSFTQRILEKSVKAHNTVETYLYRRKLVNFVLKSTVGCCYTAQDRYRYVTVLVPNEDLVPVDQSTVQSLSSLLPGSGSATLPVPVQYGIKVGNLFVSARPHRAFNVN